MIEAEMHQITADFAAPLIVGKGSWRQYPAYAEAAALRVGADSGYFLLKDGANPIAIANIRSKRLPFRLGASCLISHGPVLLRDDEFKAADLSQALKILDHYSKTQGLEIRLDPDPLWYRSPDLARIVSAFESDHSGPGYRTFVIDLEDGLDAIRKGFKSNWRGSLRQGERNSLECVRSNRPEDILKIAPLLSEAMARKGFVIDQGPDFFAKVAAKCDGAERILAHLVYSEGELISAHIGSYSGNMAVYLLGSTSSKGLAMRASHIAQWHAISTAFEYGLRFYDTGGIDPEGNPGVFAFKKGMGGQELLAGSTRIFSPRGLRGKIIAAARRGHSALRK